jgi:hypothetical protein
MAPGNQVGQHSLLAQVIWIDGWESPLPSSGNDLPVRDRKNRESGSPLPGADPGWKAKWAISVTGSRYLAKPGLDRRRGDRGAAGGHGHEYAGGLPCCPGPGAGGGHAHDSRLVA